MKIEVINGKVCCTAENWQALLKNEKDFLSECFYAGVWGETNKDGIVPMIYGTLDDENDELYTLRRFERMYLKAKRFGIEITADIATLAAKAEAVFAEERTKAEIARQARIARENWEGRLRDGCDGCRHCQKIGDCWFRCSYSGDELDGRLTERWNVLRGVYELFHEVGIPNEHCKYYLRDSIIKKEN